MSANFETPLSEHDLRCAISILFVVRDYLKTAYLTVKDDEWLAEKCERVGMSVARSSRIASPAEPERRRALPDGR